MCFRAEAQKVYTRGGGGIGGGSISLQAAHQKPKPNQL